MQIYLDNAATTKPCKDAVDAVVDIAENNFANPSSLHGKGFSAEKLINEAKQEIAAVLSCKAEDIFFTSGATESNNLAIKGSAVTKRRDGKHIIISAIEHPSVMETIEFLKNYGYDVSVVYPAEDGRFKASDFIKEVTDHTVLVSCMLVNNEVGTILPVMEIADGIKRINPKIVVHCDAVQGFLKMPIKLRASGIDLMSFSSHKVQGFKGLGGLYIHKGTRLAPIFHGGMQQNGVRSGTEPVELIGALGEVVKQKRNSIAANTAHYKRLNSYLREQLDKIADISINSSIADAPYILNFSVAGIRSEIMLHYLEQFDIYVSSGSACSKGKKNYVLTAMGKTQAESDTAIRVSFCEETTTEMLDILVQKLVDGINSLAKTK